MQEELKLRRQQQRENYILDLIDQGYTEAEAIEKEAQLFKMSQKIALEIIKGEVAGNA